MVKKSTTDKYGVGVFLIHDVSENQELCNYPGIVLRSTAVENWIVQRNADRKNVLDYQQALGTNFTILAHFSGQRGYGHLIKRTPHFECVNVRHRTVHDEKTGSYSTNSKLIFIAKKDLKAGTQLLTNYGDAYDFQEGVIVSCPAGDDCEVQKERREALTAKKMGKKNRNKMMNLSQ